MYQSIMEPALLGSHVQPLLPGPQDQRVLQITVRHLLSHTSGFDNKNIGYDPAFRGQPITSLAPQIVGSTVLASNPGTTYSYSNFG